MDEELFDNGIDGEPFAESELQIDADYEEPSEGYLVSRANGLEVMSWSAYGNYTIITDMFHVYFWPWSNILEIYSKEPNASYAGANDRLLLTLKNHNLSFFGDEELPDEDGKVNISFYTGEKVNQKIQRYLNLKAFL